MALKVWGKAGEKAVQSQTGCGHGTKPRAGQERSDL